MREDGYKKSYESAQKIINKLILDLDSAHAENAKLRATLKSYATLRIVFVPGGSSEEQVIDLGQAARVMLKKK
jgi:hypothetical protein